MKKIILLGIICALSSCSPKDSVTELEIKYERSLLLEDISSAIFYLHEIIHIEPENISAYNRLSKLYLKTENYRGVIKASEIAQKEANTFELKELLYSKVEAHKKLKQPSLAIGALDSLSKIDSLSYVTYQYDIAVLHFENKNIPASLEKMETILQDPMSSKLLKEVVSQYGTDKVSYRQAALNFIGATHLISGDLNAANSYYQQLLNETKTFSLANNNYVMLKQKQAEQLTQKNK